MTRHQRPAWHDAYDAQMALWRWYRTERALDWMRGSYRVNSLGLSEGTRQMLLRSYDGEMGRLIDCDPLYVSEEMCEVIDYARESFKPEPILEHDFITPRGFLWFARPFGTPDRFGIEMPIQAVSWAREYRADSSEAAEEALAKLFDGDAMREHGDRIRTSEMDALVAEGLIEAAGVGITLYAVRDGYFTNVAAEHDARCVREGRKLSREEADMRAHMRRVTEGIPVVPFHLCPWWFGMTFDGNEADEIGEPTGARGWWTLVQTALRLMQQKRPALGYGRPDRATRRAGERIGFPPETEVVIVRLRREEHPRPADSEPTGRTLTYRHLRTGHWRNQWYPSAKVHRQIFIAPTVVGDESLPLIMRPRRVFQWTK